METEKITSRKNPLVVSTAALKEKKFRDRSRRFIAEGSIMLSEALLSGVFPETVFCTDSALELLPALPESVRLVNVADSVYEKLSAEDSPEGILSVFEYLSPRKPLSGCRCTGLILENVQDPGNVGTVIRTSAALGLSQVALCGCADIYNPKTVRSTMGAIFRTAVSRHESIKEAAGCFKNAGCRIIAAALDKDSKPITSKSLAGSCAVMIGNEGRGLTEHAKALADEKLIIPMTAMESLNAAVAASIFIWEMKKQNTEA